MQVLYGLILHGRWLEDILCSYHNMKCIVPAWLPGYSTVSFFRAGTCSILQHQGIDKKEIIIVGVVSNTYRHPKSRLGTCCLIY